MARRKQQLVGPPCPTGGEAHGGLLDFQGESGIEWYCPHAAHANVAYTIDGVRVQGFSRSNFSDKEASESQEAYWKVTGA